MGNPIATIRVFRAGTGSTRLLRTATRQKSFVSTNGDDQNNCNRNAPCRTFSRGVQQVDPHGEVIALNSGGFGRFTADKSVTVLAAPGVFAGVTADSGQTAVTIAAANGDTVVLRGLTLRGTFNIFQTSFGILGGSSNVSVHVESCSLSGFGIGIGAIGTGQLFVKDSTFKNSVSGIQTIGRATFDNCRIEGNGTGLLAGVGSTVTIRRSVIASNSQALTAGGSGTQLNIDDCTVSNNGDGIRSDSFGSVVRVTNTTVTGNTNGLLSFGGALLSRSPATNTVEGNTTNGSFTGTFSAK
jgi:hypothetical protein